MRTNVVSGIAALALLAACGSDPVRVGSGAGFRVVNAFTQPVDVLVDSVLVASGVPAGSIDTVPGATGTHVVALRLTGGTTSASVLVSSTGGMPTVAAVRVNGALDVSALDDTNAVVPFGATKVRVIHLAPDAGEIQVFRMQPNYAAPVEWQFPFLYDSVVTSMSNPYVQSTNGTWDIRAWRKPSEVALGWDGTTAKVTLNLASGEKRTVLVLDKPGGGIQLSVIE